MVCMLGRWRMASVVRLLKVENSLDLTPEEINDEKIATQILCKGFLDADEANLLEEEDMHVFGCKPLDDPLHLVCCNSCKKPVRASQFTAHAERCSPLAFKRDSPNGIKNEVKAKKPPTRKGRKASEITTGGNQNTSNGVTARKEIADKSCMPDPVMGVEDMSSVVGQGPTATINEPDEVNFSSTSSRGVPQPLATKIYRCQRNSQLRFELNQIYYGACEEGYRNNCFNAVSSHENGVKNSQATSSSCINSRNGSENNAFVETKSKSFQKEDRLPQASKGVQNGKYHSMNPYWENSETAKVLLLPLFLFIFFLHYLSECQTRFQQLIVDPFLIAS